MNRLWFSCHQYQPQDFWGSSQCWQLAQSLWGTWCGSVWARASCTGSTQRTPETSSAECRKPVHPSLSAACTGKAQSVEFRHTIKQGWEASRSCSLISNQIYTVISHQTPSTLWDAPQFALLVPWQEWLQQAGTAFSGTKLLPSQWERILIHKTQTLAFKLPEFFTSVFLGNIFTYRWPEPHSPWTLCSGGFGSMAHGQELFAVLVGIGTMVSSLQRGVEGTIKILSQWFVWLFSLFNLVASGSLAASAAAQFQKVKGSSPQGFRVSTSKN